MNKLTAIGFTQAMDGESLLVNTTTDEIISIKIKDRDKRWDYYCKFVKVTMEVITEDEYDSLIKQLHG